jgi:predicted XRE-type DNA-binding protein
MGTAIGEAHGNHKLREDEAREIFFLANEGRLSQRKIAAQFGVSQPVVCAIRAKRIWSHLWSGDQ